MRLTQRIPSNFRRRTAYVVGPAVWSAAIAFTVDGLLGGAWYGYAFAAVLLWAFGTVLFVVVRARRSGRRELRRMMDQFDHPAGSSSAAAVDDHGSSSVLSPRHRR